MRSFEEISVTYNLKLNKKKCGIFQIGKNKIDQDLKMRGIEVLSSYRYLGVLIDNKGTIKK